MSLGRRVKERQEALWIDAQRLGKVPRNAFYDR
jgi:hypothetical protein